MRIDLNNSIAQQVAAERAAKGNSKQQSSTAASEDTTSFSHGVESLSSLVEKALTPSAAHQAKVMALRDAIVSGQYKVNPDAMADAMIKEGSQ